MEMHPSAVGHNFLKTHCPKSHDKRIVGVYKGRKCLFCEKERQARKAKRKYRESPLFRGDYAHIPNLARVREALGVTKTEFAKEAEISLSFLCELESGKRRASRRYQNLIIVAVRRLQARKKRLWAA